MIVKPMVGTTPRCETQLLGVGDILGLSDITHARRMHPSLNS